MSYAIEKGACTCGKGVHRPRCPQFGAAVASEEKRTSYVLEVRTGTHTHILRPSWRAPYFVVVVDDDKPERQPLFIHCDGIEHARSHLALGGVLFNSELEQVAA